MVVRKTLAVPYSVVLVSDASGGDVPDYVKGQLISATGTCIAIGCRSEVDGETGITLGDLRELCQNGVPAFEGALSTPTHMVTVETVEGEQVLEMPVRADITRVIVWVDHPTEPDHVVVGVW
jgi:hypothetical protein